MTYDNNSHGNEQHLNPESGGRHRGGQPGNQNARTHGFYSRAVPPELQEKLKEAGTIKGLDQEIALLRSKIAIFSENSDDPLPLYRGIALLSRLLSTRKKLCYDDEDMEQNVMAQIWKTYLRQDIDPLTAWDALSRFKREGRLPFSKSIPKTSDNIPTDQIEYPAETDDANQRKTNQPPPGPA